MRRRGAVCRSSLSFSRFPCSCLYLAPTLWLLFLSLLFGALSSEVLATQLFSSAERRCASFPHIKVPFFFLDKAFTYDLTELVLHAPPPGWVCKASHAKPVHLLGSPFAFLSLLFDGVDVTQDERAPPDPHYELIDGQPVFYAFNPCRVLGRGCEGAPGARGRLFMYKGDVSEGHCVSNVLPHPLPVSPWERRWLQPFNGKSPSAALSAAPGEPVPEDVVTGSEDPRWDPLDPLDADGGIQAMFRYYDETCPSRSARVNVRIECDRTSGNGAGKTVFSSCQRTDKCVYRFSFQSPAGCPVGSMPYQPLLGSLLEPSVQPKQKDDKASVEGRPRSSVDVTGKAEAVPAIPLLSRQAGERVLDRALRAQNEFVLAEMRALSKNGLLDPALKQRLELGEKGNARVPASKSSRQPTLVDGRGTSSLPVSQRASGYFSRPAEMFSAVPESLKSTLTHPILEYHHDAGSNGLFLFFRIVLCVLVILIAYFAIADWITREFAVRGTLKPPACGGGAGEAMENSGGAGVAGDLSEAFKTIQQWRPSGSAAPKAGPEYGSFRECFRVLPLIEVGRRPPGPSATRAPAASAPVVQLPERQPESVVAAFLPSPSDAGAEPVCSEKPGIPRPEVYSLSPRTASRAEHSGSDCSQPVSSSGHSILCENWSRENSAGGSTAEGSAMEGGTSSGSSRGGRTPRQYEEAFEAQPDAEDELAFSVHCWTGEGVRAGSLYEWGGRAVEMGGKC